MNKHLNIISGSVMILFATSLIGCGEGLSSGNGSQDSTATSAAVDITAEVQKAEQANKEAELAMKEANLALKSIQNADGSINVSLFKKSNSQVSTVGILSPIVDKLRAAFDTVFAKVALVKSKFNQARAALTAAMAKLDPNDPAQAALIAQITKQMASIDAMEAKFSTTLHSLAGKLDLAITALEKIISGVTNFIPGFGWLVNMGLDYYVMGDIRDFVAEIKLKLLAL